jgi:heme/copper-type cytochrome/quinol oxidase subunit 2
MTARVIAVTPEEFEAWLTQQSADLRQSQALLSLQRRTREGSTAPAEGN